MSGTAAGSWGGEAPVPSPCINVCKMLTNPPWCEGCLRSLDEIAAWGQMGNDQRQAVWLRLAARRAALPPIQAPQTEHRAQAVAAAQSAQAPMPVQSKP